MWGLLVDVIIISSLNVISFNNKNSKVELYTTDFEKTIDVDYYSDKSLALNIINETIQDYKRVDNEFIPYVDKFFRDLDNFGIKYSVPEKFIIEFKDSNFLGSHLHGVSLGYNKNDLVEIYINRKSWDSFKKTQKYYIVYHELCHDILNLEDLIDVENNYGQIMFPYISRYDSQRMDDFITNINFLLGNL